jgi:hypothetical protein
MWYKVHIDHRRTYTLCVEDGLKVKITRVATVRRFVIVWTDLICIEPVLSNNNFRDMKWNKNNNICYDVTLEIYVVGK